MKVVKFTTLLLALATCVIAEPISLAVTQIEPIGVDRPTAQLVEEMLQTELAKIPLFQLVERSRLDELLREQELQLSGITSTESATQAGNVLNVQKVVFGSLGRYDSEYVKYLLTLRLVDVERASVEAAENIQIRSQNEMLEAVSKIAATLGSQVEITGRVTRVEEQAVYTSLGEDAGVAEGDTLSVAQIELIRDEEGSVIMREEIGVANLITERISEEGSRCRVLEAAGDIVPGLPVRKGVAEITQRSDKSSLMVRSVPENAKVFLDGEFLGVTPLTLADLEPNRYEIEIRAGGSYIPYTGRIVLKAGSNITLERELEADVEIEDILVLGKVPRRATDSKTALKRSLVPGLGAAYNGYPLASSSIALGTITGIVSGLFTIGELSNPDSYFGSSETSGKPEVMLGISLGAGLFTYLSSLLDAYITASNDFLYPSFLALVMGISGNYSYQLQHPDTSGLPAGTVLNAYTAGVSGFAPGFHLDIILDGYTHLSYLNLNFAGGGVGSTTGFDVGTFYRFLRGERLMLGLGFSIKMNLSSQESFHWETESDLHPAIQQIWYPALMMSYRSARIEADLMATPYTLSKCGVVYEEPPAGDDTAEVKSSTRNNLGILAEVSGSYFFNLKTGIRLSLSYAYLKNIDTDAADQGYTDIDVVQFGIAKIGVVYRF